MILKSLISSFEYFFSQSPSIKNRIYLTNNLDKFGLKKIDIKQASSPDYLIANSRFVQNWIKETYKLNSEIIYPPVDVERFKLQKKKENYFY